MVHYVAAWSKKSSSRTVSETLKYFNPDEFIEETGENTEEKGYIVITTPDRSHAKVKIFCSLSRTLAVYYMMNRGAAHQQIFGEHEDYETCLQCQSDTYDHWGMESLAYCLRGNHDHLCLGLAARSLRASARPCDLFQVACDFTRDPIPSNSIQFNP